MKQFPIKRGDTSPELSVTLTDGEGGLVDVTAAEVRFLMMDNEGTVIVDEPASVPDAEGGVVEYHWQDGDTDTAGLCWAEFEVTFPDGHRETFPNQGYIQIQVLSDIS